MLILAAIILAGLGLVHSYLGEKYLIRRLLKRDNLPVILGSVEATKATLRFAWHITSLSWWGMAGMLAYLQFSQSHAALVFLWMCCGVFLASGIIALWFSKGRHKAWIGFMLVAALTGYAALTL
jgi:hypothetical protein